MFKSIWTDPAANEARKKIMYVFSAERPNSATKKTTIFLTKTIDSPIEFCYIDIVGKTNRTKKKRKNIMKYKGIELKEFTSDKPVVFDPPKKMLVWDVGRDTVHCEMVIAYIPREDWRPVVAEYSEWMHCAEIPEELNCP